MRGTRDSGKRLQYTRIPLADTDGALKGRAAELEAQIAWFRRQMLAGGKSEKIDPR